MYYFKISVAQKLINHTQ